MGPTRDRQDPGGTHVGPMNLAIWEPTRPVDARVKISSGLHGLHSLYKNNNLLFAIFSVIIKESLQYPTRCP